MQAIIQALENVKAKLTEEIWIKKQYFAEKNGHFCMCVHGAVQAEVNPEVKKIIESGVDFAGTCPTAQRAAAASHTPSRAAAADGDAARVARVATRAHGAGVPGAVWNERPNWVKENYIFDDKNYGNVEAHYLLGMVGLTTEFQDDPATTFPMIQEKLDQAIALAKELNQPIAQSTTTIKVETKIPNHHGGDALLWQLEYYLRVSTSFPGSVVGIYAANKIPKLLSQLDQVRGFTYDVEAAAKEIALEEP